MTSYLIYRRLAVALGVASVAGVFVGLLCSWWAAVLAFAFLGVISLGCAGHAINIRPRPYPYEVER